MAALVRLARVVSCSHGKADQLGLAATTRLLSSLSHQPSAQLLDQEPCKFMPIVLFCNLS